MGEDFRQSNPSVRILEDRFAGLFILLPCMRDERWLLFNKQIDQASQHSRSIIDPGVGSLAEEERQKI